MTNKITIIGSINIDRILRIKQLPLPGETMKMTDFAQAAGGKGANQAIAAVRSGSNTNFIGAVGADADGQYMLDQMKANDINTSGISIRDDSVTGQAYILLQQSGQNSIIVNAGANSTVDSNLIGQNSSAITNADFVITQFETPIEAAIAGFKLAKEHAVTTILNPAPAAEISDELLKLTDIIAPNETESAKITGIDFTGEDSLPKMAEYFHRLGIKAVIITLGSTGSFVSFAGHQEIIPSRKVKAVDTTAAGDTFIGALASELHPDLNNLVSAMKYATIASSLTVQKLGAFPSIPTREQILAQ